MRLITNFMLPCLNLLFQHTAPPEGGSTGSCLHFTDWDCHVGTRNAETSVSRPRTLSCGYDKFLNTLVRAVLQSDSGFTPFRYQFTADRELQESEELSATCEKRDCFHLLRDRRPCDYKRTSETFFIHYRKVAKKFMLTFMSLHHRKVCAYELT